ncbi:Detected protein of confused Function [Hibiscus syriacus]|uniref:Detected protein of confused Function n=1 Tax=Hibiscus syriacus TaxID=106335 RepID=A0A6A2Z0Z5_HIBSY|nr:Detected protein of confused Function [Hibiscus syriacus]
MAPPTSKLAFRVVLVALLFSVLFYVGRPLYWKISATVHDIRHNKQTVKEGTHFSLKLFILIDLIPHLVTEFHRLLEAQNLWGGLVMNLTLESMEIEVSKLQGD